MSVLAVRVANASTLRFVVGTDVRESVVMRVVDTVNDDLMRESIAPAAVEHVPIVAVPIVSVACNHPRVVGVRVVDLCDDRIAERQTNHERHRAAQCR
jgi:hypothetical protein